MTQCQSGQTTLHQHFYGEKWVVYFLEGTYRQVEHILSESFGFSDSLLKWFLLGNLSSQLAQMDIGSFCRSLCPVCWALPALVDNCLLAVAATDLLTSRSSSCCYGSCLWLVNFPRFLAPSTSSPAWWPPGPATKCLLQLMNWPLVLSSPSTQQLPLSQRRPLSPSSRASCRPAEFPVALW